MTGKQCSIEIIYAGRAQWNQFKLEFYQKTFQRSISELQGSLTEFSIFKHDRNQHYISDSNIAGRGQSTKTDSVHTNFGQNGRIRTKN